MLGERFNSASLKSHIKKIPCHHCLEQCGRPKSKMADSSLQQSSQYEAPSSTKDALTQDLDDLIKRYLYLLDHYQSLQQNFTKQLSSVCGFSAV